MELDIIKNLDKIYNKEVDLKTLSLDSTTKTTSVKALGNDQRILFTTFSPVEKFRLYHLHRNSCWESIDINITEKVENLFLNTNNSGREAAISQGYIIDNKIFITITDRQFSK